jgi:hypothetical protein
VLFILGLCGIGGYAIWERVTDHPDDAAAPFDEPGFCRTERRDAD